MSARRRIVARVSPAVGAVLTHRLFGRDERRTTLALAYLGGFCLLFAVSYAGSAITVGGAHLDTYTRAFDSLTATVIVVAVATMALAPFVYAVVNGGPLLSFSIPIVPIGLAELASWRYVLGLDGAIALTAGAAASAFALYVSGVRTAGTLGPWRQRPIDADALLVVTALVFISSVTIARFVTTVPEHVTAWYAPFLVLWLVPAVIVPAYWGAWLYRTVFENRVRRPTDG